MNSFKSNKIDFAPKGLSTLESMGIHPDDNIMMRTWGRIMQVQGLNGYPMKILGKADEFFGGINYRMRLTELAHDRAMLAKPADKNTYASLMQQYIDNPHIDDHKAAIDFAEKMVLSKKAPADTLVGKITESKWGKIILPFTRVTYNAASFAIEHSPFAWAHPDVRAAFKTGTQAMKDEAMAKIIVGTSAIGALSMMGMDNEITGPLSPNWRVNQALSDSGKEPKAYAMFGYSLEKLDTIRPWMALGYTISQVGKYLEKEQVDNLLIQAGAALTAFFTSNQLLENISDVADLWSAIGNGEIKGIDELKKFTVNFAGRFAPKAIKEMGAAYTQYADGTVYKRKLAEHGEGLAKVEELAMEIRNHYASLVPSFNKDLPVYRNLFAEPQELPPGLGPDVISPLVEAPGRESQVMERLRVLSNASQSFGPMAEDSLHLNISMPAKVIRISNEIGGLSGMPFEMTPKQYDRYMEYFGNIHAGHKGPTLREQFEQVLGDNSPYWKALTKEQTAVNYKKIFDKIHADIITPAHARAKFMMLSQDEEFSRAYEEKKKAWTQKEFNLLPSKILGQ